VQEFALRKSWYETQARARDALVVGEMNIESTYDVDGMKVRVRPGRDPYVSGEMDQNRWLTDFAVAFIKACQAQKKIEG
jgi:hypothetical protein